MVIIYAAIDFSMYSPAQKVMSCTLDIDPYVTLLSPFYGQSNILYGSSIKHIHGKTTSCTSAVSFRITGVSVNICPESRRGMMRMKLRAFPVFPDGLTVLRIIHWASNVTWSCCRKGLQKPSPDQAIKLSPFIIRRPFCTMDSCFTRWSRWRNEF